MKNIYQKTRKAIKNTALAGAIALSTMGNLKAQSYLPISEELSNKLKTEQPYFGCFLLLINLYL